MRSIWIACLSLAVNAALAQEFPVLTARLTPMKFCTQAGIRTIRLRLVYDAKNAGTRPAVVPRVVKTRSVTIFPVEETGQPRRLKAFTPKISDAEMMKLEGQGGIVVKVSEGQRVAVYGADLLFFVDASERKRAWRKPPVVLTPGRSYRLTADVELWTTRQLRKWVEQGYLTRQKATVSTVFAVPADPVWRDCPDEPALLLPGKVHRKHNESPE